MILTIEKNTPEEELDALMDHLQRQGVQIHPIIGQDYDVYGLVGNTSGIDETSLLANPYLVSVQRVAEPYKLANRKFHPQDTIVEIGDLKIGDGSLVIMAGPCAVESREQMERAAQKVKEAGARVLRGGAYKPRTSPYAFQGLEKEGLKLLKEAGAQNNLPVVSELMSADRLDEFLEDVDIIQIGARNMQNFALLKAVGQTKKPVLLKRGLANTIEEWIMAAEYILAQGNPNVILCERGIRTFEPMTRNTLDMAVIPIIKEKTHLPIIIDPSHATGNWRYIEAESLAAIAAGADGLILEVHPDPAHALCDGAQSLKPDTFKELMEKGQAIAKAMGKTIQ